MDRQQPLVGAGGPSTTLVRGGGLVVAMILGETHFWGIFFLFRHRTRQHASQYPPKLLLPLLYQEPAAMYLRTVASRPSEEKINRIRIGVANKAVQETVEPIKGACACESRKHTLFYRGSHPHPSFVLYCLPLTAYLFRRHCAHFSLARLEFRYRR